MKISQPSAEGVAIALAIIGLGTISLVQILLGDRLYAAFDKAVVRESAPSVFPKSGDSFKPVEA